ncbi:hypothetical protein BH09BAC1_BH09BAC1_27680 [soil metagenome]
MVKYVAIVVVVLFVILAMLGALSDLLWSISFWHFQVLFFTFKLKMAIYFLIVIVVAVFAVRIAYKLGRDSKS